MSTPRFVSPIVLGRNMELVAWVRTIMTIVSGCLVGIAGLTGVLGFAAYLVIHVLVSLALLARLGSPGSPADYFPETTPLSFVVGGVGDNLLLYVVFWALSYAGLYNF
jgi:hypothetical protein